MHSIVFYELTRTRTELDREAERRRLARTELPLLQRASVGRRPPGARSPRAIRWSPWIRRPHVIATCQTRISGSRHVQAVTEPPRRRGLLRSLR